MKYAYSYSVICTNCNKTFVSSKKLSKSCSQICTSQIISKKRQVYTEEQMQSAIVLKMAGKTNKDIAYQTGIKKSSLDKLFSERGVSLSEEHYKANIALRWEKHEPIKDGLKNCGKCNKLKSIDQFHTDKNSFSGYTSTCISCSKEYYAGNSSSIKARVRAYAKDNQDKIKETNKIYYLNNQESFKQKARFWSIKNPDKRKLIEQKFAKTYAPTKVYNTAMYRASKKQRTPPWLSEEQKNEIQNFYINCPKMYHVDHIVPLNGDEVSGLHVPWNLAYLPKYLNESKNNKFEQSVEATTCFQHKRKLDTLEEDIANGFQTTLSVTDFELSAETFTPEHRAFIERYEWLGTVGFAPKWVFTARYEGNLGAVVIISEPNAYTKHVELEALISRGASASWTPKNLGSRIVMFSVKWMTKNTTKRVFIGYSDHEAGEVGTIYQACNFYYLGRYFGANTSYKLDNGKLVGSRHFTRTSSLKKWAKELGIEWLEEWTKINGFKDTKNIPKDVLRKLLDYARDIRSKCEPKKVSLKGKYFIVLGKDKRDYKKIRSIYDKIWGNGVPYPKRK